MKKLNVSTSVIITSTLLLLVACSPKGFEAQKAVPTMEDTSEAIPEVMSEENSEQTFQEQIQERIEQQEIQNMPAPEKEKVVVDPTLGYKLVVIIDRAKQKSTDTAQRLAIFKWNEDLQTFELFNQGLWKVSTGVQIPITETITIKSTGVKKVVTSQRFTPTGFFIPHTIDAMARSSSYQADMPNAVWFWRERGYAVHATGKSNYKILGQRASHGCIRLTLDNSKIFFDLVRNMGKQLVVNIDRLSGQAILNKKQEPVLVKRFPVLVIVTDPTDRAAKTRLELARYVEDPSKVLSLFQ